MIQPNNGIGRLNSLNSPMKVSLQSQQSKAPKLKKANTLPQRMMEDFLERQQIYEKINRPYQRADGRDLMTASAKPSQFHKFRDAVLEAKQRFQESSLRFAVSAKKQKSIEHMAELLRKQKLERGPKQRPIQQNQKQLDLRILLIIIIPMVFLLTVLIELM